jgi:hypothetical protein
VVVDVAVVDVAVVDVVVVVVVVVDVEPTKRLILVNHHSMLIIITGCRCCQGRL